VTVVWARHGESTANVAHRFSHRVYDGALTERGRRQAHTLGQRLAQSRSWRPAAIVCSPLRRARQTADIVAGYVDVAVASEVEDLRELDVGDLDGRDEPEAWADYARVLEAWRSGRPGERFPGGEDLRELQTRLLRGVTAAAALAPGDTVLVVAHGGGLRAALPGLAGADPEENLANTALAVIELAAPGAAPPPVRLEAWNLTA
jgi:probable phosphoglycerate mutase